MINVLVWNEYEHEKRDEATAKVYPKGIHTAIAEFLGSEEDICVKTATLDDKECGLTQEVLDNTDVLLWWGHVRHGDVPDEVALRVLNAVLEGMGMIFLHSGHHSKPFKLLMGTSCNLGWREEGDMERVWVCKPSHPIVEGVGRYFELEHEETYCEPFDIPEPEQTILMGWFEGGEVFRAGCCYSRGNGKVFYFQPGHESYPTYYVKEVQTIIKNAVRWARPAYRAPIECPNIKRIGR